MRSSWQTCRLIWRSWWQATIIQTSEIKMHIDRSYILAYNSHSMKDTFNVHRLDMQAAAAASFCFSCPPKVNPNIDSNASKFRKKTRKVEGTRNNFSESNLYGRQVSEDEKRQFVRY